MTAILWIVLALGAAFAALVDVAWENDRVRVWIIRDESTLDERDHAILAMLTGVVIGYRRS